MRKLLMLISLGCIGLASAEDTTAAAIAPAKPAQLAFSLAESAPLSLKIIDYAWANRENLTNQRLIADYLQSAPAIPDDYETAWKTARLVYFIGNYGIGEKEFVNSLAGVKLFDYGVSAAKVAINLKASAVEGQYWYAVDLGCYGLAKGIITADSQAKYGIAALERAYLIDPAYQWYGSSRILGRYYQELPFIFGGDKAKALSLLKLASEKAPQFKDNWVFLGNYYVIIGEAENGLAACQKALSLPNQDGQFEEMRYTRAARECVDKAKAKLG